MLLALAKQFENAGGTREQVLSMHPIQLSRWLDEAWAGAALVPELPIGVASTEEPFLGDDAIIGALRLPLQPPAPLLLPSGITPPNSDSWTETLGPPDPTGVGLIWDHLIYAYLIESTGVMEVFAEVVRRLVHGETLGTLSTDGVRWLRATEELFYRDPPLFSIGGTVSELRPHARVNRRNAYWRMFGLDLPHSIPAGAPGAGGGDWKAHVGLGANTDFRAKWSELLRQIWLAQENFRNTSGSNPTDASFVALLCEAIADMLNNRRRGGLLAREEFAYVTVLSWFDLTLQTDSPIVKDLKAEATSAADRLAMIGQRVGMTPAARSRELFELAPRLSSILRSIELGLFNDPIPASALFDPDTPLGSEVRDTINLWQSSTDERVKDRPSGTPVPVSAQPLRVPAPSSLATAASAAASNGQAR